MNQKGKLLLLTLTATSFVLACGSAATRADDLYRQQLGEANTLYAAEATS